MKKGFFFLFLVVNVLNGFSQSGKGDYLALNLKVGETYELVNEKIMHVSVDFAGNSEVNDKDSRFVYGATVVNRNGEGFLLHLEVLEAEISQGTFLDKLKEIPDFEELSGYWSDYSSGINVCLENLYMELSLNFQGKVNNFAGKDSFAVNFIAEVNNKFPEMQEVPVFQSLIIFLSKFIADECQTCFSDLFDFVPDHAIEPGDSWDYLLDDTESMKMSASYQLERFSKECAFVRMKGEMVIPSLTQQIGRPIEGWIEGFYVVDLHSGWIKRSHVVGMIDINENVEMEGLMLPFKMKMTVSLEN